MLNALDSLSFSYNPTHLLEPVSRADVMTTVTTGVFVVGRGSKIGDIPGPEMVNSAGTAAASVFGDDGNGLLMIAAGVLGVAILFSLIRRK